MRVNNVVKISGLTLAGILTLSACGDPSGGKEPVGKDATPPASTSSPSSAPTRASASASSSAGDDASSGAYKAAAWALPITDAGDKLGTMKGEGFSVDIYQVATDVASKDSMFIDKETNENLLKKGAPVVYLNYVVTNTSSAEVPLSHSLVTPKAKYTDWKYMGGMPSDSSSDGFKKHGLSSSGVKLKEKDPFVLKPGESFNIAENFAYTSGKETEITATMTPQDTSGNLDHDKKEKAETTVTLK